MQFHRPHSHPVAVNCYGDKTVAWEPDKTVIHHPAPIMSSSFLPFTLYRLNGTKLFIILQLLPSSHIPAPADDGYRSWAEFSVWKEKLDEPLLRVLSSPTGANKSSAALNGLLASTEVKCHTKSEANS